MNYWLFLFPLFSAFMGWFAAWLAVKWWFQPGDSQNSAAFEETGQIPGFQQKLAGNLGKLVSEGLISFDEIELKIIDPENLEKIIPEVEDHMDHFLRVKLKEVMPVIGMLIGDKTILQLKGIFMDELQILFPVIMKSYVGQLKQDLDIEKLIRHKLLTIPPAKLKAQLFKVLSHEIRGLKIFGGVLGLAIGLIQVIIILFLSR